MLLEGASGVYMNKARENTLYFDNKKSLHIDQDIHHFHR